MIEWVFVLFTGASNQCPTSHKWAYFDGDYCCRYDTENVYAPEGTKCDGGKISLTSSCCKNNEFTTCPYKEGCVNAGNKNVTLNFAITKI